MLPEHGTTTVRSAHTIAYFQSNRDREGRLPAIPQPAAGIVVNMAELRHLAGFRDYLANGEIRNALGECKIINRAGSRHAAADGP